MGKVIEIRQIWNIIQKYWLAIIMIAVMGSVVGYLGAKFLISPTYSSSTSMLVNRSDNNTSEGTANLSDQQAAVQLITTYKSLITSDNVLRVVSDSLKHPAPIVVQKEKEAVYETLADGTQQLITPDKKEITAPSNKKKYDLSVDELKKMISISNQQNSQVFSINVESKDPVLSATIANAVAKTFKNKIGTFMNINNVSIIDSAIPSKQPISPNIHIFTLAGFVLVGGLSFLYLLVKEILDTAIKSPDEVSQLLDLTNLGVINYINPIKNFNLAPSSSTSIKIEENVDTRSSRLNYLNHQ